MYEHRNYNIKISSREILSLTMHTLFTRSTLSDNEKRNALD